MLKKIIIAVVILIVIAVGVIILVPWGEYESTLDKSDVNQEVAVDSTGTVVPSLSLIQGDYAVNSGDGSQAEIVFDIDGLKKTKGGFNDFSIEFSIAEDYTQSTLNVAIQSASVNTNNRTRDEHLLDEDFFNSKNYPLIKFTSSQIEQTDTAFIARGELTLLKETKAINVPFKHLGNGTNAAGLEFEAFEGNFLFDRTKYGMEEVSGAGNIVTLSFYCELILQSEES